jgi:hypothetical protein
MVSIDLNNLDLKPKDCKMLGAGSHDEPQRRFVVSSALPSSPFPHRVVAPLAGGSQRVPIRSFTLML